MIAKAIDGVVLPILLLHPLPPLLHLRHLLPRILVAEILLPLTTILNHLVARVVRVAAVIHHRATVVVRVAERIQAVVVEVAVEIVVVVVLVVTSGNLEIINANLILLRIAISASSSSTSSSSCSLIYRFPLNWIIIRINTFNFFAIIYSTLFYLFYLIDQLSTPTILLSPIKYQIQRKESKINRFFRYSLFPQTRSTNFLICSSE